MDKINLYYIAYVWITYSVTLVGLLYIPSKMDSGTNLMGSLLLSLLGPIIWPIVLIADLIVYCRKAPNK